MIWGQLENAATPGQQRLLQSFILAEKNHHWDFSPPLFVQTIKFVLHRFS